MTLPFWYREAYAYNPGPTLYITVAVALFLIGLVIGARMLPGEEVIVDGTKLNRGDIIAWGIGGGALWGFFVLGCACYWAWRGFEWLVRLSRQIEPSSFYAEALVRGDIAPQTAADHAFLGTPMPEDPYLKAAREEVDALLPEDDS
jgi:hypothetical protein